MLSPKLQRNIRVNDMQLQMLSERAHRDNSIAGYLKKKTAGNGQWRERYFVLYQNLLFYYDNESASRPCGVLLLEGCYCERLIASATGNTARVARDLSDRQMHQRLRSLNLLDPQHCFAISWRREGVRQYELKAPTEVDCNLWIDAMRYASYNSLLMQNVMLEQKHLHLVQIVESERTAKKNYGEQCEELEAKVRELEDKLAAIEKEKHPPGARGHGSFSAGGGGRAGSFGSGSVSGVGLMEAPGEETLELRKIKKVQSFFRGWLCRRRWKQIVDQYIKSPHAESMRKRNSLVFRMVEAEEEYTDQMEVLVSCFLRPFKMAASSKKPPCSHEDVNSIFLNAETVLFLHQIFLKGLTSRMESWPTLVLGDLFDMLLPMLSIYQEYVRSHHYSVQVLTECMKRPAFAALVHRLEEKPACQGRSLATFLTYPMHQVPRYVTTLTDLLAHTPHDHVERKSLMNAQHHLEELSRQMHDEVSETENLRKNLAVERMIVEGCDILLDVNQVFVRQGSLIQLPTDKPRAQRSRLASFKSEKEAVRQCFLFSNHLIIATRAPNGRLHLVPDVGKISLADALLVEDPSETSGGGGGGGGRDDDESSVCSTSSQSSNVSDEASNKSDPTHWHNREFKLLIGQQPLVVHLVASTVQEKQAWISDIQQCMDNVHFNDLLHNTMSDTSSIAMPQSMKNDPKLFKDDVDIRFSRTLNSCKVPQIRYATKERLLERLTDLRFLSIDFLNTFLLTYRVFTDAVTVLEALKKVFYNADPLEIEQPEGINIMVEYEGEERRRSSVSPRRTSQVSSVSGYGSEAASERDRSHSYDSQCGTKNWRSGIRKYEEEQLSRIRETQQRKRSPASRSTSRSRSRSRSRSPSPSPPAPVSPPPQQRRVSIRIEDEVDSHLAVPQAINTSSSAETLTDMNAAGAPSSPSNLSTVTLVPSPNPSPEASTTELSEDKGKKGDKLEESERSGQIRRPSGAAAAAAAAAVAAVAATAAATASVAATAATATAASAVSASSRRSSGDRRSPRSQGQRKGSDLSWKRDSCAAGAEDIDGSRSGGGTRSASIASSAMSFYSGRRATQDSQVSSVLPRDLPQVSSKAGVVITSFRQSQRRSSTSTAAAAFAVATSASSNPRDISPSARRGTTVSGAGSVGPPGSAISGGSCKTRRKESVLSTAATMRVLNVLRHWVSKHAHDFEQDQRLKDLTIEFLDEIIYNPNLLPAEHKAASQLMRLLTKEEPDRNKVDLAILLAPPTSPSKETIETLSALEIAEQMTYLDHQIFVSICSEEFLGQAWMKEDKAFRAPRIVLMTQKFNERSRLVVSEIVRRSSLTARVAAIEKWAAVADIARCLHNFNGMLQVCAAFTNSAVYRLKKTWEKVSKTTRQTVDKMQAIVSSDGRFRNLRESLHRCDPPCIPYLGMYLTDLSLMEEMTPNFTEDRLLNFSKMRMIAHVIREIRHFQQVPYKIEHQPKVANYLQDPSLLLEDDDLYRLSLEIEPRTSRLSAANTASLAVPHTMSFLPGSNRLLKS